MIFDRLMAVIAERVGHRGLTVSRLSRHVALAVSEMSLVTCLFSSTISMY